MEENLDNKSSHDFEVAKFVGSQHLTDIREIKNHQRNITFQYILIAIAIAGLTKIDQIKVCHLWIKAIVTVFALIVIVFILLFQKSLSNFRRRIYKIWEQPYFKHAMEKEFLNVDKNNPGKYFSFWYQFQYPLIYMFLVLMVMIALLLIL
jgi:hypothetical protein